MSTIKDIAAKLGISHSTVSRALNDSPLVNANTKRVVKEMAEKLGYVPNESARSLKLNKSSNVGVFLSSITVGTSPAIVFEVIKMLNSIMGSEYNVVLKSIDAYHETFQPVNRQNFEGIIVFSQKEEDDLFIKNALDSHLPLVVVNRHIDDMDVISLYADDELGAKQALDYLYDSGHRQINIIEGCLDFHSNAQRLKGVYRAQEEGKVEILGREVGDYTYEGGYQAMLRLIESGELGTALFAFNDDMAVGAMKACNDKGIALPDDYSIVGFDGNYVHRFMTPALATIHRPIKEICQEAASILIDEMKGNHLEQKSVEYENVLVKNGSVKVI